MLGAQCDGSGNGLAKKEEVLLKILENISASSFYGLH